MTKGDRVKRYLSELLFHQRQRLATELFVRFRRMVVAQHALADGDDRADELVKAATADMIALATATAAKVFKAGARSRLAPPLAPAPTARRALPAMADEPRGRREVSTDGGKTWIWYGALIDPDPFENYKHRRVI